MAQLNITLDQDEMLQLLAENRPEAFRELLQTSLNRILQAESDEQLGAGRYERSETRTDSRNGSRERQLSTRIGRITLQVPRHRNEPFHSLVFDNYSRSESALLATMAGMVVEGIASRKVSRVMEILCGTSFSKSTVSAVCRDLDKDVQAFRDRPLTEEYPFVMVDATYFKVRENHRVTGKALMVALGTTAEGKREIIGFAVFPAETKDTWETFLRSLRDRGLHGVSLITSDAHEGIVHAISRVFPDAPWQRCQTHFSRNILSHAPKQYQTAIHDELQDLYRCDTIEQARRKRDEIIREYQDVAEKAMQCLDDGFEDAMIILIFPKSLRRFFRTSNHLERLNRELKRRSNVIGVFPNEASLVRLMGSVLLELQDRYTANSLVRFSREEASQLPGLAVHLREAAAEQHKLLPAA